MTSGDSSRRAAENSRPSAAVIGGVAWNTLVEVPRLPTDLTTLNATSYRESIGGTGAGKALHLSRLGLVTRLHALIGDDPPGDLARKALEDAGVSLTASTDPAGTERHLNLMNPRGDRLSIFVNRSSEAPGTTGEELARFADGADLVFVSLTHYSRAVLPLLQQVGVRVWVDLHDWDGEPSEFHEPFVAAGSYVFLSDIRLADPLRTAESLLPGKELVVLTHGKRGATAFFPDTQPLFVPPYDAGRVVDTNGAGDAFCAGTAYGRAHGWGWPESLRAGAVVAGGCVTSLHLADPELTEGWLEARV